MRVSDTLNTIIILRCVKIIIPTVLTEIHIKNRQIEILRQISKEKQITCCGRLTVH